MAEPAGSQAQRPPKKNIGGCCRCCNPLQCRCCGHYFPLRIVLAIMLHLCLQTTYNARVVLNVAIVEMVEPEEKTGTSKVECPEFGYSNDTASSQSRKFQWPRQTKAFVLYAFFIGYTLSQIPGGYLADRYGSRWVLITCVIITIVSTAILPLATYQFGWWAAVVLRFILGFAHGPSLPAISSMMSIWFPRPERPLWGGIAFSGTNLGTILGNALTGVIITAFGGWHFAFYFWAAYSVFYLGLALLFVFSYPDSHPFISDKEATYIMESHLAGTSFARRSMKTPWKRILLNLPYWANVAAQFGHNYIFFTMVTYLPTYMKEILQFDVQNNGLLAATPFFALWVTALTLSFTTPHFMKCMSEQTFIKVFGAGSNVATAALLLAAVYAGCNRALCIFLYILGMMIKAFYYVSLTVNINALTTKYGGFLFGICNTIGSLSGIIGNFIIGSITKEGQIYHWRTAFWITLAIQVVTALFFAVFGSAERQKFDYEEGELPEESK